MKTIFLMLFICSGTDGNDCAVSVPATWTGSDVAQELRLCAEYGRREFDGKANAYWFCDVEQGSEKQ